nr:hypothetical protein [Tanacetum cinerariifolium]
MFSLKVNCAGCFTESLGKRYVNDDFAYFDCIDIDEFSVHELNDMVNKLGFSGKNIMYYSFLKPDMSLDNGMYALGNDEDVRRMAEYIRLGYKMIEVFIEHDKTTVFTYIDAAYNTLKHKCLIIEIPEGVSPINASPVSKMKPRRPISRIYAKKLLLGWKQNDANVMGGSSSRPEDGESSQPNTANLTTQTNFANDFYSTLDPYLEVEDFDHFFGLDSDPIHATTFRNEWVGKGKGVALDDDQIHVDADGNNDGDTSESSKHDEFMDTDNQLVDVEVGMDHFDTSNAKTMGNDGTTEFNANEVFDIGIDVIDTKEFESASNEDGIERIRSRKMKQLKKQNNFKECGLQKSRKIKYCTADFLSEDIIEQIETNPEILIKAIQEQLQRKFQLEVSRMKAFTAKPKAVENMRGDFTLQYIQLRDYVMELQQSNPNTTVRIGVESKADHMKPTRVFKRICVCLRAAKEGFKVCMRQFLGFNGTYMKGPFPGQLLTAVGVDPNNDIYPLAYGIVETKSRESWIRFFSINIKESYHYCKVFPAAEHMFCLRHIYENMKLKWRGAAYKELLWKVATALTVPYFEKVMDELKAFNKELDTWKQVYNHHVNPIRGKIMWPKSPIPTTILPPNHHPQVGRPPKNRKKSASKDIQMVKNEKLSRASKNVTCVLKGHNKRSCIGPRKDACNKGSISNAGKKRPRSETITRTSQAAKKPNNAAVGVQTRSKDTNKGNQATSAAKSLSTRQKRKCSVHFLCLHFYGYLLDVAGKVIATNEIMDGYVMPKYRNKNLFEDDSWIDIIMDDVYDTFYRDEEEEAKVSKAKKFLAMVESEKARVKDYTKLVVTDGMVMYWRNMGNKWKSKDEIIMSY